MAGQASKGQGDHEPPPAKAREAREQGKRPSEVGATTGADKQARKAPDNASHQEKMELENEGQEGSGHERQTAPRQSRDGPQARGRLDVTPSR
jgi:hypothetical protein